MSDEHSWEKRPLVARPAAGASELKGVVMPEIGGWMSDAGNICNEEGYGIVITLPQGGYMTMPPEMGRRILKALSSA